MLFRSPVDKIVAAWRQVYGEDRVGKWIEGFEASDSAVRRDFDAEDVV